MACSTIQDCATNKYHYYINIVCIQTVPHWVLIENAVLIEEIQHTYIMHEMKVYEITFLLRSIQSVIVYRTH